MEGGSAGDDEDGPGRGGQVHSEGRWRRGGPSVTLMRATYKLDKAQAEALGSLLGSVKAPVLEVKVDGTGLTLTTTPEVQATVGQIVRLITGQAAEGNKFYRVAPMVPPVPPAPPAPPTKPVKPVKPSAQSGAEKPEIEVIVVPASKPEIELVVPGKPGRART